MVCLSILLRLLTRLLFMNGSRIYNSPSPPITTVSVLVFVKHPVLLFVDIFLLDLLTMFVASP